MKRCTGYCNFLEIKQFVCLTYGFRKRVDMNIELSEEEIAAMAVLRSTGVSTLEAAQVAQMALKMGRGRVKRALRCISEGNEALKQQERTDV